MHVFFFVHPTPFPFIFLSLISPGGLAYLSRVGGEGEESAWAGYEEMSWEMEMEMGMEVTCAG